MFLQKHVFECKVLKKFTSTQKQSVIMEELASTVTFQSAIGRIRYYLSLKLSIMVEV
jgi:hypothetical protein